MKNILILIPIFGFVILFIACNQQTTSINPPQPAELYEKYKNSVAFVYNEFYYTVEAKNGTTYYYSPSTKNLFYTSDINVEDILSHSSGTGFYISNKGTLITNRHVVEPYPENFKDDFLLIKNLMARLEYELHSINDTLQTIQDIVNTIDTLEDNIPVILPTNIIQTIQTILPTKFSNNLLFESTKSILNEYLISSYNEIFTSKLKIEKFLSKFSDLFDSNPSFLTPVYVNHSIKILNNESNDLNSDTQECRIIKISQDEDVDLALIKTIHLPTNTFNRTIFDFTEHNPNIKNNSISNIKSDLANPVGIDDEVYIIGFNNGLEIGLNTNGLHAQLTKGNISQKPDGVHVLYTIPILTGSSGSPVIDKWGNLVAVNFAGIGSQGFNLGIPVYKLYEFLNGKLDN